NDQRFGAIFISVVDRRLVARAIDMSYRVLAEKSIEPDAGAGNDEMARSLRELVEVMAADFPVGIEIGTVVLSLSGLLDIPGKIWCVSSRWPQLRNLTIAEVFRGMAWPLVLVRNLDAELAGIRLQEKHADSESALLLHWGFGIGAAFSADGSVINRNRGRFCEIGHWTLGNAKGRPCTCGNQDCLETVAAGWALGPSLRADHPDLPLDEAHLAEQLRQLDLLDFPSMREALAQVLRVTANLCRLLFPDRLILTGPFVQNPDVFHQFVETVATAPLVKSLDKVRISVSEVGQNFEIIGALDGPFATTLMDYLASSTT
ncbi:MAG: ROK family protein, partial [Propionivibrio sp.]